jgi:hypothetical protein
MKRFLTTLVAIASLGIASTAANAQSAPSSRHKECENTATCDQEIEFKGKVTPACSCDSEDGKLPVKGLTKELLSSAGGLDGKFTATCNTTTAKVTYSRLTFEKPGAQASIGEYKVIGPAAGTADDVDFTTANATRNWPSYTPKTAIISARVTAPPTEMLQAGDYKIVVKASVTP